MYFRGIDEQIGLLTKYTIVEAYATHDEEIDIAADDQHITGTLVSPATFVPGVLFVHGWGGSQENIWRGRGRSRRSDACA